MDADLLIRMKAADIALALLQMADEPPADAEDAVDMFLMVFGNVQAGLDGHLVEVDDEGPEDGEAIN